jgi:flagellar basal-body rod protein FlgB
MTRDLGPDKIKGIYHDARSIHRSDTVSKGIGIKPSCTEVEGETPMADRQNVLAMAQSLASHAASRQSVLAKNIANADTPAFRAKDLPDFSAVFADQPRIALRVTRDGHRTDAMDSRAYRETEDAQTEASPNGNTVSLEREMVKLADVRRQHDLALTIYKSSLDLMRASLGRGR